MRWHLLAAVALVAVAGVAPAQQPRQPGGVMRQQTPLYMTALTNEELQKDLKITDDQKKSLKEVMDKAADLAKKRADAGNDMAKRQELQKEAMALAESAKTATDKAFTDDQKKRLKQIEVQQMGLRAFTNEDVVKAMKFTDDQKAKLKTLGEDFQKANGDLMKEFGLGGGGRPMIDPDKRAEYNKKAAALMTETMDKAKKELTDDQKKAWADLTGAAFDLTKLQQGGRPRGN